MIKKPHHIIDAVFFAIYLSENISDCSSFGQEKGLFSGRGVLFMSVGQEKGPNSGRQLGLERPVRKTAEGDEATASKSWMAVL